MEYWCIINHHLSELKGRSVSAYKRLLFYNKLLTMKFITQRSGTLLISIKENMFQDTVILKLSNNNTG